MFQYLKDVKDALISINSHLEHIHEATTTDPEGRRYIRMGKHFDDEHSLPPDNLKQ